MIWCISTVITVPVTRSLWDEFLCPCVWKVSVPSLTCSTTNCCRLRTRVLLTVSKMVAITYNKKTLWDRCKPGLKASAKKVTTIKWIGLYYTIIFFQVSGNNSVFYCPKLRETEHWAVTIIEGKVIPVYCLTTH
jgi:hypothetical protein